MGVLAGLREPLLAALKRTHRAIRQEEPVKLRQCWNSARERLARPDRGEEVEGGLTPSVPLHAGLTRSELKRARRLAEIPRDQFEAVLFPRVHKAKARAEGAVINAIWRKRNAR